MNKKEQLYDAVLRLTAAQGLWDTPMSQIATYANMAVGSIYHHFASKEQLLTELFLDTQLKIATAISPHDHISTYKAEFQRFFESGYDFLVQNPLLYKYSVQVNHSPLLSQTDREKASGFLNPFKQFFENGINQGAIEPGNALLHAHFCYGQIQTLAQVEIDGLLYVSPILKQQFIERSWNAIKTS